MVTKLLCTITYALRFTCRYGCTNDLKFNMARYFLFSILILSVITALQESKFKQSTELKDGKCKSSLVTFMAQCEHIIQVICCCYCLSLPAVLFHLLPHSHLIIWFITISHTDVRFYLASCYGITTLPISFITANSIHMH